MIDRLPKKVISLKKTLGLITRVITRMITNTYLKNSKDGGFAWLNKET